MAKNNNPYFKDFLILAEYSCEATEYLYEFLKEFSPGILSKKRGAMHELLRGADQVRQVLAERLIKELVPPIEREDIISLANMLDNITAQSESLLNHFYMYNIRKIRPDVIRLTKIVMLCTRALQETISEFPNFKKSEVFTDKIKEVHSLKKTGDEIFTDTVRAFFRECRDPGEQVVWSRLFDMLWESVHACELAARQLEIILIKNL